MRRARLNPRIVLAAVAVLGCSAVPAAEPPASPSAVPIKHSSAKTCAKQADAKKLSGPARTEYLKSCQGSKPS